jgi:hypothetical protein
MSKTLISGIVGIIFLLVSNKLLAQKERTDTIRLMFYNVENMFDTFDDSLKNDNDFLPGGLMRWNLTRYNKKINSLYKTIIATGKWDPPAIMAFCEVENRKVLEDIIFETYLSKFRYRIVHEDSPDRRGIDVCLIYREDKIEMISYRYWIPNDMQKEEFTTRSVLYSKFRIGTDTLHIIVNHWPSRRGGVLSGEDLRVKIASTVKSKADSIIASTPLRARLIIVGDFNCTPDDAEMKSLTAPENGISHIINLSEGLASKGKGTYKYMGTWEMIDQILVSDSFMKSKTGMYTDIDMFSVYDPGFLLIKDRNYPGVTPFSTYRGFRYQGGFSDHLPVLLDLVLR